ncbi:MAG: hypothetical protein GY870_18200, partial [archaeon]|nr:hypothetical protein [archaeon]
LSIVFLGNVFKQLLQALQIGSGVLEISEILYISGQLVEVIMLFSIIIVLIMFEKNNIFSIQQLILAILASLSIGGLITSPSLQSTSMLGGYLISFVRGSMTPILLVIFNTYINIILVMVLIKNRKEAKSKEQTKLVKGFSIGFFCSIFFGSFLVRFIEQFLVTSGFQELSMTLLLFKGIILNLGMIIIGLAFLRVSKSPWLLQNQKVHLLLVYSIDGIAMYMKSFRDDLKDEDLLLLSGAFSAVTSLFQEATKTTGTIQAIKLEGKELRIIEREHFLCAILVEYSTQASEVAHENFVNEFEKKYNDELKNFEGEVSGFTGANIITSKYFFL